MKKLILLTLLIIFIFLIPLIKAETLLDSYGIENYSSTYTYSSTSIFLGEPFKFISDDFNLSRISLYIKKFGNPICNISLRVFNIDVFKGSNYYIDKSIDFNVSIMTTTLTLYNFTFNSGTVFNGNFSYYFIIHIESGIVDANNYLIFGIDNTSPTYYFLSVRTTSYTTFLVLSYTTIFYIYGNEIENIPVVSGYTEQNLAESGIVIGLLISLFAIPIIFVIVRRKK